VNVKDYVCVFCNEGFIEPILPDEGHLNYSIVQNSMNSTTPSINSETQQPNISNNTNNINSPPGFVLFQQLIRGAQNARSAHNGPRQIFSFHFGPNINTGGFMGFDGINNMIQQIFGNLPTQMGDFANDAQMQNILNQLFMQHQNQGPPPASENAVSKLPRIKITFSQTDLKMDCSVCQCEFELDEEVVKLPCDHLFHSDCILPWFKMNNSCPVCRFELPTDNEAYENSKKK